jgi:protein-tyrosine phosphatase
MIAFRRVSKMPEHCGYIEIYDRIYLSSYKNSYKMAKEAQPDILVPLYQMNDEINKIWKGQVISLPIEDYGVLPIETADMKTDVLVNLYKKGKSIGIFCYAGLGRTGYIASIILGKLGIDDPFEYIWKNYSDRAIETSEQFNQATEILEKPDLHRKYYMRYKI